MLTYRKPVQSFGPSTDCAASRYACSVGHAIRFRFVALDLVDGWIELGRAPWKLRHVERSGALWISIFPVAEGVTMDLPTMQHLARERRRREEQHSRYRFFMRSTVLDETGWLAESISCLATRERLEMRADPFVPDPEGQATEQVGRCPTVGTWLKRPWARCPSWMADRKPKRR